MLRILRTRVSSNPSAEVDPSGNFNITSDGRLYFLVDVANPANPFDGRRSRMISQQFNSANEAEWRVDPASIRSLIGTVVGGDVVRHDVEPYELDGRMLTSYTTVVFAHESPETVFKQAGHPIKETQPVVESVKPAVKVESTEEIAS
jgi:hypothetical protein